MCLIWGSWRLSGRGNCLLLLRGYNASMKLLLTSAGLVNPSLVDSLNELVGRSFGEVSLAFIPTAANVEPGDKDWLIDDLYTTKSLGFKEIDIVDISALPKDVWKPRLEKADVIMVGGGNTFHLMHWVRKSGLDRELREWLNTKVYVGISAGSMICTKALALSQSARLYSESIGEIDDDTGLSLVDFQIRPHLNSPWFPNVTIEKLQILAEDMTDTVYALDDNCAVKVVDGKITVVGTGEWKRFN